MKLLKIFFILDDDLYMINKINYNKATLAIRSIDINSIELEY